MLRILTFSSLYPNAAQPTHGVFVEQRLRHLMATGGVAAAVVAPVPWFPTRSPLLGHYGLYATVPVQEVRHGITIHHPRHVVIPKVGMRAAAWLMEHGVAATVASVAGANGVQLIDAHYLFPDGVVAARLATRLRLPYVLTARGSDINLIGEIAWYRRAMRRAIEGAALTITVSEALRQRILEWGIAPNQVRVVRNGVDFDLFKPPAAPVSAPRDAGVARRGRPALLSVGKLDENKGHHLVIEAVRALPEASLTIVGDGPMRAALLRQIRAAGLESRVHLIGAVGHGALVKHYCAADMLVLASRREGLPNVVLEALACGTPVVATRVGGLPEAIDRPELGELAATRDSRALVDAIRRLEQRPRDRERIRECARRFDRRLSYAHLEQLLTEAAIGTGAGCRRLPATG